MLKFENYIAIDCNFKSLLYIYARVAIIYKIKVLLIYAIFTFFNFKKAGLLSE